ncbi:MAG: hypothetical protein R3335_00615 [Anaerolineales bacterium]|nr:hypothetical protein [Anaerolineales bacterium]
MPVAHILPLTTIRRERLLPITGRVLARSGQKVKPTDIVAEATVDPQHQMLNIARGLGVTPIEADQLVQRKAGEGLVEGDIIAERTGIAKRVMRSPITGRVVMVGEGQILIEADTKPYQLRAGLPGTIAQIIHDQGVVVETTGALVQGVWGNGKVDYGLLSVIGESPESELDAEELDVRFRGAVVIGGHCGDEAVLNAAAELTLRGLILGSISARLVPLASKLRFPVVVLEGFGRRSINPDTYKLIATNEGREVVLTADSFDRYNGTRPEVVIPLSAPGQPALPQDDPDLSLGQKVRIVRAPHAGAVGSLAALPPGLSVFPSGLKAQAARVTLTSGENVLAPVVNLEILS